jgi:hypothetical protein
MFLLKKSDLGFFFIILIKRVCEKRFHFFEKRFHLNAFFHSYIMIMLKRENYITQEV